MLQLLAVGASHKTQSLSCFLVPAPPWPWTQVAMVFQLLAVGTFGYVLSTMMQLLKGTSRDDRLSEQMLLKLQVGKSQLLLSCSCLSCSFSAADAAQAAGRGLVAARAPHLQAPAAQREGVLQHHLGTAAW